MKRVIKTKIFYKCVGTDDFKEIERNGGMIISIRFTKAEIHVAYKVGVLK